MTKTIWFFLRRYKVLYGVLVLVILVSAVLETLSVGAIFPLMTSLLGGEVSEKAGNLLGFLETLVMLLPIQDRILAAAVLLALVMTGKALVVILREYLIVSTGASVVYGIKQEMFDRIISAPYSFFLDPLQKDLNYRLTTAPQSLGLLLFLIPSLCAQTVIIFAIFLLLATISWKVNLVILIVGGVVYGALRLIAKRISYITGQQRSFAMAKEMRIANEFLGGIKEIIVNQSSDRWRQAYSEEGKTIRRVLVKDGVWQMLPGAFIEWVFFVLILGAMVGFAKSGGKESLTHAIPMMTVYVYALYRLIRSVSLVAAYKLRIVSQLADAELLRRTLEDPLPMAPEGNIKLEEFSHSINFDNVSLIYPNHIEPALKGVSFEIKKGKVTALVGHSGAGKTSTINLLLRLYGPSEGVLLVDSQNIEHVRKNSWLGLIGYVSQEAFILNGTIAENILFGFSGCSLAEVEVAAKAAQAHEFIMNLPLRYQALVGPSGMTLSGGQRQRIAIARALLRKPEILIFDEATSALDSVSEGLIQKALRDYSKNHTVILVAHRLSTIRFADQIVVLDHGKVVEIGNHEGLLALQGPYSLMMDTSLN